MLFDRRIGLNNLAGFCRRMGTQLAAGLDPKNVLQRELAAHRRSRYGREIEKLLEGVRGGREISELAADAGEYFPAVFREMVAVGDQSGRLPEIFLRLAEMYEHQLATRRAFLSAMAYPFFQFVFAIVFCGLMILVRGALPSMEGKSESYDIIGLGLSGVGGFIVYCCWVACMLVGVLVLLHAVRRGMTWAAPIQKAALVTPQIGRALQTLSLARLSWAMHATLDSSMNVLTAIPLSLRASLNPFFIDQSENIINNLRRGGEIGAAFAETQAFPEEFVEAIQVGEEAGSLPEQMSHVSRQYQEQAQASMVVLSRLAGFLLWMAIAGAIIFMILRLALQLRGFYDGMINNPMGD